MGQLGVAENGQGIVLDEKGTVGTHARGHLQWREREKGNHE